MHRYARQVTLAEIGEAGQARLSGATVLVVGAGGLGSPVLQYLAGAGCGRIRIVDHDRVELANLHRQPIFGEDETGQSKAAAAARRLTRINSEVCTEAVDRPLNPGNAGSLLKGVDVALDCADNFAVSYTMSDACGDRGVPLISASALALGGYAGGFCGGAPTLRAVFPDLPAHAGSCAEAGVVGPVVGIIGCIQAQFALAVLLDWRPSPLGQLVKFDGCAFRFAEFDFRGAAEPAGRQFGFTSLDAVGPGDFVADLRSAAESPMPATAEAVRASVEAFGEAGPRPDPGRRAVLCCRTGVRAWQAARRLGGVWDGEIQLVAMANEPPEPPKE